MYFRSLDIVIPDGDKFLAGADPEYRGENYSPFFGRTATLRKDGNWHLACALPTSWSTFVLDENFEDNMAWFWEQIIDRKVSL
jgi:hypothetical protein